MNKRNAKYLLFMLLVGVGGTSNQVYAATPCAPTQLSQSEAEELLMSTKTLSDATQGGRSPLIDFNAIAPLYQNARFYQAGVYGSPCEEGVGDGCLIGWYAVDKVTARVVNTVLDDEETGPSLQALQSRLRASHCISEGMVKAAADIWP